MTATMMPTTIPTMAIKATMMPPAIAASPLAPASPPLEDTGGGVGATKQRLDKIHKHEYCTLHVHTECLIGPTSSGNSAAVDTSCYCFIATAIQADSAAASGYVESLTTCFRNAVSIWSSPPSESIAVVVLSSAAGG